MTFTSWQFGVFAALVFALYYTPALRAVQVYLLVAASVFFYGYGQLELLPLLGVAVFGTYFFLLLAYSNRRAWLPAGIAFNLALLAFFKYKFLFLDPALPVHSTVPAVDFLLRLPLPLGISFFVFHNISLLVDLTKPDRVRPTLSETFLYIIFFPQLVSGPITRAEIFMPQIRPKFLADVPFVEAAKWIVAGYFFKLCVANNLNEITSYLAFPFYEKIGVQDKWWLVLFYSYQIYADFFGYSAIALGLGLLFGYRLPVNFNLPYISASFSEFWTRWHMSLSQWLRTYLYIPLGGNRHGPARTYLNIMVVMGLGGLWHGAAISYLVWGALHGLLLAIERPFIAALESITANPRWHVVLRGLRIAVVFFLVSILWILFKLPDFGHALAYLQGMFSSADIANQMKILKFFPILCSLPVVAQHILPKVKNTVFWQKAEPYVYGLMLALSFLEAGPDTAFIYFQF